MISYLPIRCSTAGFSHDIRATRSAGALARATSPAALDPARQTQPENHPFGWSAAVQERDRGARRPRRHDGSDANNGGTDMATMTQVATRAFGSTSTGRCVACSSENPSDATYCQVCGAIVGGGVDDDETGVRILPPGDRIQELADELAAVVVHRDDAD